MTIVTETASLKPSSDSKVQNRGGQKNSYGLLPGREGTCPGATQGENGCTWVKGAVKKVCYVDGLMRGYPNITPVLTHNTEVLKNASRDEMERILTEEYRRFRDSELRYAARTGKEPWLAYRNHWSGDYFSEAYAQASANAMAKFPDLLFWGYTRSFFAVPILSRLPHVMTYISLDPVNMREGLDTYYRWQVDKKHDNVQVCYLSPTKNNDFEEWWHMARKQTKLKELWPQTPMKLSPCPVDLKKLPTRHGCSACQKCLGLRQKLVPIWFCP